MASRKAVLWTVTLGVIALVAWRMHVSHFDWITFWRSCHGMDVPLLVLAILFNYSNALFRSARWAIFLKPSGKRVPWWSLIGSQFIGFAGLAALGRVGELIRPYLISRRTGLSFASQIGVLAVERIFDLGAFGILFAGNLVLSPQLQTLPFHQRYRVLGYAIAAAIAFLSLFVVVTRIAGETLATRTQAIVSRFSAAFGASAAAKIRAFREGLNTIGSPRDFVSVSVLSLLTWTVIALGYVLTLHAFPPPVHNLTIAHAILLMGFSVAGGLVQLPGIGGGPQLMTALALTKLFGIPAELAASTAIVLWIVSTASAVLPGLIFARTEQVSLRSIARTSGEAAALHPVH